jgi:butyrate kinase
VTVQKAASITTDEMGGMIANTIAFTGQLPSVIGDPVEYGPIPQASRLTS